MRSLQICLTLIVLMASCNAFAEHMPRQTLVVGEASSVETDYSIGDVAVSNHRIVDFMITDSRREIYLNPKKEGVVTLTVWDAEGRKRDVAPIEVYKSDIKNIKEEAAAIFGESNVEVKTEGGRVVLKGDATSKADVNQAKSFAARYPEVENRVKMSKEVLDTVAEKIKAAINLPGVKVKSVHGRIVLEGVAYSSVAAKKAAEIAGLYEPDIVNLIEIRETGRRPGRDDLIKLDVYFVEIKKEVLRSIGIRWAPGSMPQEKSGEGGSLFGGITSLIGFIFNLAPKIKLLSERGQARILDNASFVVKSGESADFFNGTQIPFYAGEQVSFKDVGVKVHAEPIAEGGEVDLVINATVSSPSANIDAGIDTHNISTSAYVPAGESIILGNMISNREVVTYNRRPTDVNSSSAIFDLALSKDFQSGRSEFVMFVQPTVLNSSPPAEAQLRDYLSTEKEMIKNRSQKEYQQFLEKIGEPLPETKKTKRRRSR